MIGSLPIDGLKDRNPGDQPVIVAAARFWSGTTIRSAVRTQALPSCRVKRLLRPAFGAANPLQACANCRIHTPNEVPRLGFCGNNFI
jgi:hypothetical protein